MSQTENDTIPLPPRPSASPAYPDEYDINNPSEHNAYSETGDHNTAYSEIGDSLNITAMGLDLTDEAAIDDNMLQVLSTAGNTDVHYKMVEGEVDSDEEAEQKLLEQAYKKGAKKGFKGGKAAGFKGGISALVRHSVASVFDKVGEGMSMNKYETTTGYQYVLRSVISVFVEFVFVRLKNISLYVLQLDLSAISFVSFRFCSLTHFCLFDFSVCDQGLGLSFFTDPS